VIERIAERGKIHSQHGREREKEYREEREHRRKRAQRQVYAAIWKTNLVWQERSHSA
jgi:hypothetical protein